MRYLTLVIVITVFSCKKDPFPFPTINGKYFGVTSGSYLAFDTINGPRPASYEYNDTLEITKFNPDDSTFLLIYYRNKKNVDSADSSIIKEEIVVERKFNYQTKEITSPNSVFASGRVSNDTLWYTFYSTNTSSDWFFGVKND